MLKSYKILLVLVSVLSFSLSAKANKIVFLGDSNTALINLMPNNNPAIGKDMRFTSLIADQYTPYHIPNIVVQNSAVGGAKTMDFLPKGKYFNIWPKDGDVYVLCFGLNDAPNSVAELNQYRAYYLNKFRQETQQLMATIKQGQPNARIILMTNVDVNYLENGQGDYSYPRNIIINAFDNVYRQLSASRAVALIDVNAGLRQFINQGRRDLRMRYSSQPIIDTSMDRSPEAQQMGRARWMSNIHYNVNGSKAVAEILGAHAHLF